MRRREFIGGMAALALASAGARAAGFSSSRFSVAVRGSGPDVMLIPGLTSPRSIWDGLVSSLPGYRYHLVQVAGFAGEPAGGNARGPILAPLADELARYILVNGLRAPALIGHSMGGTVGMMLAARRPGLLGRLMVVDMLPAPAGLFGATAADAQPLADMLLDALTGTAGGQMLLQSMMGGGSGGRAASDANVVARATHELAVTDLTDDLPRIRVPMTVVYATARTDGSFDPATVVRAYQAAYRSAPTARLIRIADSGHMIMADQPGRFLAAVTDFLR